MRYKNALKKFAYETFRPHSKEEYAELFSRGNGGNEKTPYPWFYARIFLISLLLFTVLCVSYSMSNLNFLLVMFAGGIFADLTFIVLLLEIYPKRDLSLSTVIFVFLAGGILSSAFIYIQYGIANFDAPFADQAWTALVEETGKALTIFIILFIVKKRNPLACFIIGAAVGGGYSAFENMWLMYAHGFGWGELSQAIEIGLWRALGTPFSHAAWAGVFGWALGGIKPWLTWKPYAAYVFGFTMHFFVNFPLMSQFNGWNGYIISAVTGILSIALIIFVIIRCRSELVGYSYKAEPYERLRGYPKINGAYVHNINGMSAGISGGEPESFIGYGEQRYRFIANVLAAAAIFCFSFTLLGPTCVFGGYVNYKTYYYDNWQTVLDIVQGERDLNPDYEREYVEYADLSKNYSYTWTDGELVSVIQRERYGNYYYRFTYGYTNYYSTFEDEEGNFFVWVNGNKIPIESDDGNLPVSVRIWEIKNVGLELNGNIYYPRTISNYVNHPTDVEGVWTATLTVYRYFLLNSSVSYLYLHSDGRFEVDLHARVAIRKTESVIFSAVFFAAFIGCGVAYIVYKRRIKNAER